MSLRFIPSILTLIGLAIPSLALAQDAGKTTQSAVSEAATAAEQKQRRRVPDTLMFTIDEFTDIKDRMAGGEITEGGAKAAAQGENAQALYLGSIMYYGPKDWTIWINGSPIGPDQDFQAFQVTDISPRHVELLVPLSLQGMRPVRLEPNQTFITESGIVVEGKYP